MTQNMNLMPEAIHWKSMKYGMLAGASIGLVLISLFLLSAGEPNPAWGQYWRIKPMVVMPIAGAIGGAFAAFMLRLQFRSEVIRLLAILFGILGFIVALWLGSVLGLNGTYWN